MTFSSFATARRRAAMLATAGLVAVIAGAVPAAAEEAPVLMLSWNAPYGENGATTSLTRDCGDTTRTDTLYLSYRLQEDHGVFAGVVGTLLFHPQFSDTLAEPWQTPEHNVSFLKVDFPSDTSDAFRAGWKSAGVGAFRYYGFPTQGMVRLIYAVPATTAAPVSAGLYCFARVIVSRPPEMDRCDQGLCVEFRDAKFSFSLNAPSVTGYSSAPGFVSVNSTSGLACAKYKLLSDQRMREMEARRDAAAAARRRSAEDAHADSSGR